MTTTDIAMFGIFIVGLVAMRFIWLDIFQDNDNEHK